jgi:dihydrofolate reductase
MRTSIIVAMDRRRAIGRDNGLPWHLPGDLKFFKRTTMGHPLIMGRKTYDSVGKPLPGRTNIVITRRDDYAPDGVIITRSLDEALDIAAQHDREEIFVGGGSEIFAQALDRVDRMYVTRIDHEFDGDTFFPEVDWSEWRLISREEHEPDEKNRWGYAFEVWERGDR